MTSPVFYNSFAVLSGITSFFYLINSLYTKLNLKCKIVRFLLAKDRNLKLNTLIFNSFPLSQE
ncbi:MAG: hypothetical protein A2Y41_13055 [Spirochaetes bacterium GWB1_36_13]|nr:MAG: hypothetical protein A2Y41_13055 [Spirochaetes bacterium GWB1_36_13]